MNTDSNTYTRELNNDIDITLRNSNPVDPIVNVIRDITKAGIKEAMTIAERERAYEFAIIKPIVTGSELNHNIPLYEYDDSLYRTTNTYAEQIKTDDQTIADAVNQAMLDFLMGVQSSFEFGPSHPWTLRIMEHPHMKKVRERIKYLLEENADMQPMVLTGQDNFNLNDLSLWENARWLSKDVLSWITFGELGQEKAFVYGSFRLGWDANNIEYNSGINMDFPFANNSVQAEVDFIARDILHAKSAFRIPMTNSGPPDNPFGRGEPLNDIPIKWNWTEKIVHRF